MKKKTRTCFVVSSGLLILFVLYTVAISRMDVRPIGPGGSSVGFAALNEWLHQLFGVNMLLYTITDWAGIPALLIAVGFAAFGALQLVKRKSLLRVDTSILVLGGFYLVVFLAYVFFEFYVVNYRPVLINGFLEASYPSSTTMLVLCILPTAMMQLHSRVKSKRTRVALHALCALFTAFMVVGRLLSGVHWFTDIVGGMLLSAALVMLYYSANQLFQKNSCEETDHDADTDEPGHFHVP